MRSLLLAFLLSAASLGAQTLSPDATLTSPPTGLQAILAQPLPKSYRVLKEDVRTVLNVLARQYGFTVVIGLDVNGQIPPVDVNGGTVRDVLSAITEPNGFYFEEGERVVSVHRLKTILYTIEYPKMTRSTTANTSLTLSPGNSSGQSNQNGGNGNQQGTNGGQGNQQGSGGGGNSSSSSITITQKNDNPVWDDIAISVRGYLIEGETAVINPFSGIISIAAPVMRHRDISAFITKLNRRIRRQVLIEAKLVEITTNENFKFGVDYSLATAKAGVLTVRSVAGTTDVTNVASAVLPGNTLVANLATGKLTAILRALEEQGTVKTVTVPRVTIMHNQSAVLNVSDSVVLFSLTSSVDTQQGTGGSNPFVTTRNTYGRDVQSFGTFFPVTVHIADDGYITVALEPRRSRLTAIVQSPDKTQTGANSSDESISTFVTLKSGQTAIIGGLVFDSEGTETNGIPGLSKIPLVGKAFKTDAKTKIHTELAIILTATELPSGS
jgi:MSHA biogenesis protein MshL